MYRTGKISVAFEPMTVDDLYKIENRFPACKYAIDSLLEPLTISQIKYFSRSCLLGVSHCNMIHKISPLEYLFYAKHKRSKMQF